MHCCPCYTSTWIAGPVLAVDVLPLLLLLQHPLASRLLLSMVPALLLAGPALQAGQGQHLLDQTVSLVAAAVEAAAAAEASAAGSAAAAGAAVLDAAAASAAAGMQRSAAAAAVFEVDSAVPAAPEAAGLLLLLLLVDMQPVLLLLPQSHPHLHLHPTLAAQAASLLLAPSCPLPAELPCPAGMLH